MGSQAAKLNRFHGRQVVDKGTILNREVVIDTEDIDKMGAFLGALYYKTGRTSERLQNY